MRDPLLCDCAVNTAFLAFGLQWILMDEEQHFSSNCLLCLTEPSQKVAEQSASVLSGVVLKLQETVLEAAGYLHLR